MNFIKTFLFLVSAVLCPTFSFAQKQNINLAIGFGPGYFLTDNSLRRHLDHGRVISINYLLNQKDRRILFNPGINYSTNDYHSEVSNSLLLHVSQKLFGLNLDALMKLTKTKYLRIGIVVYKVNRTAFWISNNRNYSGTDNDVLFAGYSATHYQAGITGGLCLPFKILRRYCKLDINILHIPSQLVNYDYYPDKLLFGEQIKVLSTRSHPTMLLFVFEIGLLREKRKTKENNEKE